MNHTPGPWSVVEFDDCFPGVDAGDHSVVIIGEQRIANDGGIRGRTAAETVANAKLIAAAPEMAAELDQVLRDLAGMVERVNAVLGKAGA